MGVFFETDNLNTIEESSEFMLTFLASLAQEESVKKREAMMRVVVGRNAAIRAYTEKPVPESGFRFGGNKAFLPGIVIRGTDGFRHRHLVLRK